MRKSYDSSAKKRIGFGQVELNHMSAQKTGQIYAQLPAGKKNGGDYTPLDALENGMFLKYNVADGWASLEGDGEWMLVYNEEKLYDSDKQTRKDFRLSKDDSIDGKLYPRLYKVNIGDLYTTNTFSGAANSKESRVDFPSEVTAKGDKFTVDAATGFLKKNAAPTATDAPVFQAVKLYTMPDGQFGVQLMRIQ